MLSMFLFNLLGDIFHYGFSGEPIYTMYETLTYGLFVDLAIAVTKGNLFGVDIRTAVTGKVKGITAFITKNRNAFSALTGAILGFTWTLPGTFFFTGFFAPLLYGGFVNWQALIFSFAASIPGDVAFGIIAALIASRVGRVLGQ